MLPPVPSVRVVTSSRALFRRVCCRRSISCSSATLTAHLTDGLCCGHCLIRSRNSSQTFFGEKMPGGVIKNWRRLIGFAHSAYPNTMR